jgi:hypothetical protein
MISPRWTDPLAVKRACLICGAPGHGCRTWLVSVVKPRAVLPSATAVDSGTKFGRRGVGDGDRQRHQRHSWK